MKVRSYFIFIILLFSSNSFAAINQVDLLDSILIKYNNAASAWVSVITYHAGILYWSLVIISMVWTFGQMAIKKDDIQDFFLEFIRFTVTVGFFWWLLSNAPAIADSIISSMRQVAAQATGLGNDLYPSGIVDIGFAIFDRVLDETSFWSPVDSAAGLIMAGIVLVILGLIGINMLILLCSGWILAYGGIFFLGFGGSRWTSDMAVNYFKTVLGLAAQLFGMVLIVGIGKTFLDDYYGQMSKGLNLKEMSVMVMVSITLFVLTERIPSLLSGIITGAGVGNMGVSAGAVAGAAAGAAAGAMAAASVGASMIKEGASQMAGGAQAFGAALEAARENVSTGEDIASKMGFQSDSDSGSGSGMINPLRTAADTMSNLAQGGHKAASDALADKLASINERINQTAGGKIASAISEGKEDKES